MHPSDNIAMTLGIQETCLRAALENHSNRTLRIWARTNSWGWGTLILIVSAKEVDENHYTLVPKPQIWTVNLPGLIDIRCGESQIFEVSPGEPEWDNLDSIGHLKHASFYVRAALRIPETPEAIELGVFVGQIASSLILSEPPHGWLFP